MTKNNNKYENKCPYCGKDTSFLMCKVHSDGFGFTTNTYVCSHCKKEFSVTWEPGKEPYIGKYSPFKHLEVEEILEEFTKCLENSESKK